MIPLPKKKRYYILLIILFAAIVCLLARPWNNPVSGANCANEEGIDAYDGNRFPAARAEFEKSLSFGFMPGIPTYNLGNDYFAMKDFSMAHEYYEKAIRIDDGLLEAFFNDGYALYEWGMHELDPGFCTIDRTVTLWEQAAGRFDSLTRQAGRYTTIYHRSKNNALFIREQIGFIKQQHEINKPKCLGGGGGEGKAKSQQEDKDQKKSKSREQDKEKDRNKGKDQEKEKSKDKDKNKDKDKDKNTNENKDKRQDKDKNRGDDEDEDMGAKENEQKGNGVLIRNSSLNDKDKKELQQYLEQKKQESGQRPLNQAKPQQLRHGKDRVNVGNGIYW